MDQDFALLFGMRFNGECFMQLTVDVDVNVNMKVNGCKALST